MENNQQWSHVPHAITSYNWPSHAWAKMACARKHIPPKTWKQLSNQKHGSNCLTRTQSNQSHGNNRLTRILETFVQVETWIHTWYMPTWICAGPQLGASLSWVEHKFIYQHISYHRSIAYNDGWCARHHFQTNKEHAKHKAATPQCRIKEGWVGGK